ncbi:MAG TPA: ester cyclase [Streptosporangiaceae bacterium]|nr:ester cyclase [Streptosporangiaceae bacterium]
MNSEPERTAGNYLNSARRWLTAGWAGEVAMADDLFSESLRENGVLVGIDGAKSRSLDRLRGFPDLVTSIEDMFAAGDRLAIRLVWRGTHSGPYAGVEPTGKTVEVGYIAIWRFSYGRVAEIWATQDQLSLPRPVGSMPGASHCSRPATAPPADAAGPAGRPDLQCRR